MTGISGNDVTALLLPCARGVGGKRPGRIVHCPVRFRRKNASFIDKSVPKILQWEFNTLHCGGVRETSCTLEDELHCVFHKK